MPLRVFKGCGDLGVLVLFVPACPGGFGSIFAFVFKGVGGWVSALRRRASGAVLHEACCRLRFRARVCSCFAGRGSPKGSTHRMLEFSRGLPWLTHTLAFRAVQRQLRISHPNTTQFGGGRTEATIAVAALEVLGLGNIGFRGLGFRAYRLECRVHCAVPC